jgi:RNA polymerase sigma-70 factor (sigma-E family)
MMPGMADDSVAEPRPDKPEPQVDGDPLLDLFRTQYEVMVRIAAVLLDDDHAAEEVVQEAFIRVDGKLARVAPAARAAYLRKTVVNVARSRARHEARVKRTPISTREAHDTPEEVAVASSERARVLAALAGLPRRQRECVVLRYYAALSEREVAGTLGISPGSVKTHLHRGLHALAVALGDEP